VIALLAVDAIGNLIGFAIFPLQYAVIKHLTPANTFNSPPAFDWSVFAFTLVRAGSYGLAGYWIFHWLYPPPPELEDDGRFEAEDDLEEESQ
jgi:hypothetical protein